jgi:hypothetical protein
MLERQILKYLYGNYPLAISMTLLLSALQSSVVLNDANIQRIIYWFIGLFFLQSLRFLDYFIYRWRYQGEIYSVYGMFRNFRLGIIATGLLLGAFPVLMINTASITDMVFIAFVFAGITAASISSLGVDRASLICFLLACLLPLLFCFFILDGYMPNVMASMIFFYLIYLMLMGNRFRNQLIANVELTEEAIQGKKNLASRQHISELIVKIQSAYLDNSLSIDMLESVFQEIIELSEVQYGFICQIDMHAENELSSKVLVNYGDLDLRKLNGEALKIDEMNLRPLSLEAYTSQIIITEKSLEVSHIEVFEEGSRNMLIGNFFGVPLFSGNRVIAIIGFIDIYDTNVEERTAFLCPLFQTLERVLSNIDYGELA